MVIPSFLLRVAVVHAGPDHWLAGVAHCRSPGGGGGEEQEGEQHRGLQ